MWNAEIYQISVYRGMKDNTKIMRDTVSACSAAGAPYVIHPVGYSILDVEMFTDILHMSRLADRALILHDETSPDGNRLEGRDDENFRKCLIELGSLSPVSIENATNTRDVQWFWDRYADSITLDIGHVEVSGLDSIDFIDSLSKQIIEKIEYVHIHRNNGLHGGITDHWPLKRDCREMQALIKMISLKPDVSLILEINEVEEIEESLDILRELRN
jgi:sugar phosphate isomerase/epimerase